MIEIIKYIANKLPNCIFVGSVASAFNGLGNIDEARDIDLILEVQYVDDINFLDKKRISKIGNNVLRETHRVYGRYEGKFIDIFIKDIDQSSYDIINIDGQDIRYFKLESLIKYYETVLTYEKMIKFKSAYDKYQYKLKTHLEFYDAINKK